MTELRDQLRDAGRRLDERAPSFDAVAILGRANADHDPDPTRSGTRAAAEDDRVDGPLVALAAEDHRASTARRRRWIATLAAAAVLVVLVGIAVLGSDQQALDTVPAASVPGGGVDGVADLPVVLEVDCAGPATTVRSPRVRPQRDGVHVLVHNATSGDVELDLGADGGVRGAPPGDSPWVVSAAPGPYSLTCEPARDTSLAPPEASSASRPVEYEVVDVEDLWGDPTLDCPSPTRPIGYGDGAEVGPYRETPDEAVRSWSGVRADTVLRPAGYPDEVNRRVIAEVPGGEVLFGLRPGADGRWAASAEAWCTPPRPAVRADDSAAGWYDASDLEATTGGLDRSAALDDEIAGATGNERVMVIRLWCADLMLAVHVVREVDDAPSLDIGTLLGEVRDDLVAAEAACQSVADAVAAADRAGEPVAVDLSEADAHLVEAHRDLASIQALVDSLD